MQGVPAFCAESERLLGNAMHTVIADRTVVIGTWNAFLLWVVNDGFGLGNATGGALVCLKNAAVRHGVGSEGCFSENSFEFTRKECSIT
jgi:hypothetical protein